MLLKVTPEILPDVWQKVREWLEPAISRDGMIAEETVYQTLENGYNQLWICETAAAVTSIEEYPRGRICFIWLAGGSDLSKFTENLGYVERWASEMGCVKVRVTGRKGWAKVLGDYSQPYITLEKDI